MNEQQVPIVVCHPTIPAVYAAMADSYQAVVGEAPTRATLLSLMAQWGLETGNGSRCFNWNAAGIKHIAGDGHPFAVYLTHETIRGVDTVETQEFRAYDTLEDGVADYVRVLHARYSACWPSIQAADMVGFAHWLKLHGYYTAPEAAYAAGLRARYAQMQAAVAPDVPEPAPTCSAENPV